MGATLGLGALGPLPCVCLAVEHAVADFMRDRESVAASLFGMAERVESVVDLDLLALDPGGSHDVLASDVLGQLRVRAERKPHVLLEDVVYRHRGLHRASLGAA